MTTENRSPVSVSLDDTRLAWLDAEAHRLHLTRSEFVRRLIDAARAQEGKPPS